MNKTATRQKSTFAAKHYTVTVDHDQLPELVVTQEQVDAAFGPKNAGHSIMFYVDSEWVRLYERFFQERIVHVRSNNVLLLRFAYTYEVDLDRIHTARDLLAWTLHLVDKPWMGAERVKVFAAAVANIKGFNVGL
jgi:hypothetical protein